MKLTGGKIMKKVAKVRLNAKCSDLCWIELQDSEGNAIVEGDGYVPKFFPGEHYGDYINLEIDPNTGIILNWDTTVSHALMAKQVKEMG